MRILIEFSSQPDWMNEVRFDCHLLLRERGRDTMLSGSVTCLNVERGAQHVAALFVPPSVMERYGRRIQRIAVECYYQNSVVSDYVAPRTSRKWWQQQNGVPDSMVTWFYTPFLRNGAERYEQVKAPKEGF